VTRASASPLIPLPSEIKAAFVPPRFGGASVFSRSPGAALAAQGVRYDGDPRAPKHNRSGGQPAAGPATKRGGDGGREVNIMTVMLSEARAADGRDACCGPGFYALSRPRLSQAA